MNKYKIALFVCAFVWGFGYVAMDHLIDTSSALMAIGLRFIFASAAIYIYKMKDINQTMKENSRAAVTLGGVLFLAFLFQSVGLAITTTAKNAFLTATNVIWVPVLLAIIYRIRIPSRVIVSSIVMMFGVGFVSLDGISALNIGDLLTLIGAVFFALHMVLIDKFTSQSNLNSIVFGQLFVCGVLGLVFALIFGQTAITLNGEFFTALVFAALFSTALCFFLQNYGIFGVDSSIGAIILSLEAMFGVVAAVIIDNEAINMITIIGFIIMFSAILIAELKTS